MKRILLINDEPDLLFLFRLALEDAGHTVETLSEGAKAVETARRFRPDVIGLDWVVPDMPGEEVLGRLRAEEDLRRIPVIIITALDGLDSHARRLGARRVLHKPIRSEELLDAVERAAAPGPGGE